MKISHPNFDDRSTANTCMTVLLLCTVLFFLLQFITGGYNLLISSVFTGLFGFALGKYLNQKNFDIRRFYKVPRKFYRQLKYDAKQQESIWKAFALAWDNYQIKREFVIGSVWEDCRYHPLCITSVRKDTVCGVSLYNGHHYCCDATLCGLSPLSVNEVAVRIADCKKRGEKAHIEDIANGVPIDPDVNKPE